MSEDRPLGGHAVVVTGSSSGIGAATARAFAALGASVLVNSARSVERGIGRIEGEGAQEAPRGEVALGAGHGCQRTRGQAPVVEVQGVMGRHTQDRTVHRLGPGREVRVEPEPEGDRPLFELPCRRRDRQAVAPEVVFDIEEERERVPGRGVELETQ